MATKVPGTSPDKRRKYDAAFKAEALRLASESRSTHLPRQSGGWLYLAIWLDRCSRKIVG